MDGPSGTGKTFACLLKLHVLLSLYPGSKALVARRSNTALAASAMATYRNHILHPQEHVRFYGGSHVKPAAFEFPNGSILAMTGLDRAEKIKSTEWDYAFLNEASECSKSDVEFVRSRLRNGKGPYHQLIMDTNPDAPTHWLHSRMNAGITTRVLSRHEDNPWLFDARTQDWTPAGRDYIYGVLGGLTGVRLSRLRYGIWCAAEGTVYQDSWDRSRNVIGGVLIPREWPR